MAVRIFDFTGVQLRPKHPKQTSSTVQFPEAGGQDGFRPALTMLVIERAAFSLGRFPQLLDLSVPLEASHVAAVVSPAATVEPDCAI
jgi:hypothetical protein